MESPGKGEKDASAAGGGPWRAALEYGRRIPAPLALLVAVAAVMAISWNIATAPLQGPDEQDHVAYAEHLAEAGAIPSPDVGKSPHGADERLALFGLNLWAIRQNPAARPDWSKSRLETFERQEEKLTGADRSTGTGANPVARNPPIYYVVEAATWRLTPGGFFDRVFTMRMLSGLLLMAAVVFTWLLAGEVFRRRLAQVVASGFVALTPMAGFMGGVVNPDIASLAIWTAFLWLALRTVRLGPTLPRAAGLAVIAATGAMTHGRNLPIIAALAIALVTAWIYNRTPLRTVLAGAAGAAGVALAGAAAFLLVSTASSGGSYGGVANLSNTPTFNLRQFASSIWQFYLPKLATMDPRVGPGYGYRQMFIEQFLGGDFGSHEVFLPYATYDTVQVVTGLAIVAFYTVIVINWRTVAARWPAVVIVGSTTLGILLFLHLSSYRNLIAGGDPLITGRYLLPLAPAFGLLVATIVAGLPRRVAPAAAGVFIGALFILSLSAVALSFQRFYA